MNGREWREETIYGMSSVKEYWTRTSETARSNFDTTSSENLSDDSSTSYKEYRDVGCHVVHDYETPSTTDDDYGNEINNDESDESIVRGQNNKNSSTKINFDESIESKIDKNTNISIKSSRYVRWNVLMSLGIGLWAVLCIFDVFHSEDSVTRDWLYESIWEKKNITKIVLEENSEAQISSNSDLWAHLWKIVTMTTFTGVYILFVLLLIVFSMDPWLRKTREHTSPKKNVVKKISIVDHETKSLVREKKSLFPNLIEPTNFKIFSIKLELIPSIHQHRNILFISTEKRMKRDFQNFSNPQSRTISETRIVQIFNDTKRNESSFPSTFFTIDKRLVYLDPKSPTCIQFSNINNINWNSMLMKNSASLCLMESTESYTGFNINIFGSDISGYMRRNKRRKSWTGRYFMEKPQVSSNDSSRNRIITSSPAFKKFLLTFQQNTVCLR